ncbi:MAG TPA: hypothetical protein VHZ76_07600 [Gammaproteobacteria bacterium]|jgi:hypothetical protein|nr:hypothetical protein [Gammaproteobacteria bacterium]
MLRASDNNHQVKNLVQKPIMVTRELVKDCIRDSSKLLETLPQIRWFGMVYFVEYFLEEIKEKNDIFDQQANTKYINIFNLVTNRIMELLNEYKSQTPKNGSHHDTERRIIRDIFVHLTKIYSHLRKEMNFSSDSNELRINIFIDLIEEIIYSMIRYDVASPRGLTYTLRSLSDFIITHHNYMHPKNVSDLILHYHTMLNFYFSHPNLDLKKPMEVFFVLLSMSGLAVKFSEEVFFRSDSLAQLIKKLAVLAEQANLERISEIFNCLIKLVSVFPGIKETANQENIGILIERYLHLLRHDEELEEYERAKHLALLLRGFTTFNYFNIRNIQYVIYELVNCPDSTDNIINNLEWIASLIKQKPDLKSMINIRHIEYLFQKFINKLEEVDSVATAKCASVLSQLAISYAVSDEEMQNNLVSYLGRIEHGAELAIANKKILHQFPINFLIVNDVFILLDNPGFSLWEPNVMAQKLLEKLDFPVTRVMRDGTCCASIAANSTVFLNTLAIENIIKEWLVSINESKKIMSEPQERHWCANAYRESSDGAKRQKVEQNAGSSEAHAFPIAGALLNK